MPCVPPLVVPGVLEKLIYSALKPALLYLGKGILSVGRLCARHPRWGLGASVLLIIAASLALVKFRERSEIYTNVVGNTLCRESEPTAQRYKGLEAFLLSAFASGVDDVLKQSYFTPAFIKRCEELKDKVQEFEGLGPEGLAKRQLDLRISRGTNDGLILTDSCTKSYLFLPVSVFRDVLTTKDRRLLSEKQTYEKNEECNELIKRMIDNDAAIQRDVRFSRYLADILEPFTRTSVTNRFGDLTAAEVHGKPSQVSLITKNGVNRIYNAQRGELEEYYGSLFPPDQFFPSRPYFRRTFQQGRSGSLDKLVPVDHQTLGDYFYVSHPYLDLGGNGIVVTLARGIEIEGKTKAIVCFDLCVSKNIRKALEEKVRMLDGTTLAVECVITGTEVDAKLADGMADADLRASQPEMRENMIRLADNISPEGEVGRSELFGNIQVINQLKGDEGQDRVIQASIPIERVRFEKNKQSGKLLLLEINLEGYRRHTAYWLLASAIIFGIALFPLSAIALRVATEDRQGMVVKSETD